MPFLSNGIMIQWRFRANILGLLTPPHLRHWFYEDFLRPLNPSLTSFSLRRFSSHLLHTSAMTVPLIQRYISTSSSGKQNQQQDLEAAFDEFMKYKIRVPVCGIVMLNQTWDKVRLVSGHFK